MAWPRQLAMYLAREHTGRRFPSIGRALRRRDHSTVVHACRRVQRRVATEAQARDEAQRLIELLATGPPPTADP